MIPPEWQGIVVQIGWGGFIAYLGVLCWITFKRSRRARDERKMREALERKTLKGLKNSQRG